MSARKSVRDVRYKTTSYRVVGGAYNGKDIGRAGMRDVRNIYESICRAAMLT